MKKVKGNTRLEKAVAKWINEQAADYDESVEGPLKDLAQGGCQSGLVSHLIYYTDTVEFYKKHAKEIDAMLARTCDDTGCTPSKLFGDKWDSDDPMARDTHNQNLLAWFGFEETARSIADTNGIEV